jgi:hypothetical protein
MKLLATILLAAIAIGLGTHLVLTLAMPQLIREHYPASIARLYVDKAGASKREEMVTLEPVKGRPGISRLKVLPAAVKALGIATHGIRKEKVARVRSIGAHLIPPSELPAEIKDAATAGALVASVPISSAADEPVPGAESAVRVIHGPVAAALDGNGPANEPLKARFLGIASSPTSPGRDAARTAFYALIDGHGHEPGDLVIVDVPLAHTGEPALAVPADAVLYEANGRTWIYVSPKSNEFVREPIEIEFSNDRIAVLKRGPAVGSAIVTAGNFELYGMESSIGLERVGH